MKYRVIGWTYYGDREIEACEADCAAYAAVVDEIRKNGWYFSGRDHQETGYGVPVLNDGKARYFSQRSWGGVMAEAYGYHGTYDYSLFAEGSFAGGESFKMPDKSLRPDNFLPEINVLEEVEAEVSEQTFNSAREGAEIQIYETGRARYLEDGDIIALTCGEKTARYKVAAITMRRHILPDGVQEKINHTANDEEFAAVKKIADETPVTRWVKLGAPVADGEGIEERREVDNVNKHTINTYLSIIPSQGHEQAVADAIDEITDDWLDIDGRFEIGFTDRYDADVNVMLRRTLKDFFGKEDVLKRLKTDAGAYIALEIVPTINLKSANPAPILSLDADVIEFLYLSGTVLDLDYYIIK